MEQFHPTECPSCFSKWRLRPGDCYGYYRVDAVTTKQLSEATEILDVSEREELGCSRAGDVGIKWYWITDAKDSFTGNGR